MKWRPPMLALLALAGCGDLPRPFQDNPGATAIRLSQPPPARLSVPAPPAALLTDTGAQAWAGAVADALAQQEVPAVAAGTRPGDWRLTLAAELHGNTVVPSYTVQNPHGEAQGSVQGAPVPAGTWAESTPATLKAAAAQAAPQIATLLTAIEAARQQADPNSLLNRPARVYVADVTGAPGDGNAALAKQMRGQLPQSGEVVQPAAAGADYAVRGEVKTAAGARGTTRVEIQWVVTDAAGHEGGRIVQINEVPAGSLDHYWGDVAVVVAQQAAGGVRDVISNQLAARRRGATAAKPDAAAAPDHGAARPVKPAS